MTSGGRCEWQLQTTGGRCHDTADHWWAVSIAPRINIDTAYQRGPYIYEAAVSFKGNINPKIILRQIVLHYIYNIG
jgi:hypothetical protein